MGRGTGTGTAQGTARCSRAPALPTVARDFAFSTKDGLTLIGPAIACKRFRDDWSEAELPFRSVIVNGDGQVVSAGMPKFFNYSEAPEDAAKLDVALASDRPVWFTTKVDGSLAIRSVIDGKVCFRTRGSFDGGDHGDAIRALAARKYPALLDPALYPDGSLLFEFVSPRFQIVERYEREDLVLVGAVSHADLRQADLPELSEIAGQNGLHLVETVELPREPEALLAAVRAWDSGEGIVARCDDGQTLVKIKSARHLALHRLRSSLTPSRLRTLCLERDLTSFEQFEAAVQEVAGVELDWEVLVASHPIVEAILQARRAARAQTTLLARTTAVELAAAPDRKAFALSYASKQPREARIAIFMLADGNEDGAYRYLEEQALDRALAALNAVEPELAAD